MLHTRESVYSTLPVTPFIWPSYMQRGQSRNDLHGLCISVYHAVIFTVCVFLHVERSVMQWSSWFVYFCMSCSYLHCLCLSACREVSHTVIFTICVFLHAARSVTQWSSPVVSFCMSCSDLYYLCISACREVSHAGIFTVCVVFHAERSVTQWSSPFVYFCMQRGQSCHHQVCHVTYRYSGSDKDQQAADIIMGCFHCVLKVCHVTYRYSSSDKDQRAADSIIMGCSHYAEGQDLLCDLRQHQRTGKGQTSS